MPAPHDHAKRSGAQCHTQPQLGRSQPQLGLGLGLAALAQAVQSSARHCKLLSSTSFACTSTKGTILSLSNRVLCESIFLVCFCILYLVCNPTKIFVLFFKTNCVYIDSCMINSSNCWVPYKSCCCQVLLYTMSITTVLNTFHM